MTLPHERILWATIARCEPVGAATIRRLRSAGFSAERVWQASEKTLSEIGFAEASCAYFVKWRQTFDVDRYARILEDQRIRVLLREDAEYPIALDTTHTPPEVLFLRGNPPPATVSIACVGTRRPSSYGQECVKRLLGPVATAGIPIISGLALGIDAIAHRVALEHGGYTCGVLGSGVDDASITPSSNLPLAQQILDAGGGILSEFGPGTPGFKQHFPIRNRVIAGIAQALVVIEATMDSGTMITARCAAEADRELLAVPGPIWSDYSMGTHHLIRSLGAAICAEAQDIFNALALDRVQVCQVSQTALPITPDERSLLSFLRRPVTVDELARSADWPIGRIHQALSMLELKQFVKRIDALTWAKI